MSSSLSPSVSTVINGITNPYSALEAWSYDLTVAPAVLDLFTTAGEATMIEISSKLPHGARVLDVGCGGGQVALHLARYRPDLQITGIDQAPGQVARARHRAARARARVVFQEADALDLPFATGTHDLVLSVASIKHWPDQRAGLVECLRVLAPGGTLAVVEVERGCRLQDARRFVASWRYLPTRAQRLFLALFYTYVAGQSIDLDDARQLAASVDLAEVEVCRVSGSPALMIRGRKPG